MEEGQEKAFFFAGPEGETLYGVLNRPAQRRSVGVVMVPPVGRERHRAYRETRILALRLAARGISVLRFDYRGEGESSGRFESSSLSSRVADIGAAVAALRASCRVEEICLIGLHLGAVMALAAAEGVGADRLVLLDPITNMKAFGRGLVLANVILQRQYFGEATRDEAALRAALARGESISLYGYPLGRALLDEVENFDAGPHLDRFRGRSLILYLAPKPVPPKKDLVEWQARLSREGQADLKLAIQGHFSWSSRTHWGHELPGVAEPLLEWLESSGDPPGAAEAIAPAVNIEVVRPDREVVTLHSGRGERMVGLLGRPERARDRRTAVVILQAGLLNKTGVGDYFRWLGDRLMEQGYTVLRVDQTGTGDSEGSLGEGIPNNDYFRKIQTGAVVPDVLSQIHFLERDLGLRQIHLLGQCGGCVSAFLAAAEAPESVASLLCIAMPVLYSKGTDGAIRAGDAALAGKGYLRKLLQLSSYRRLLSGASDYSLLWASIKTAVRQSQTRLHQAADRRLGISSWLERMNLRLEPKHPDFNRHFWDAFQAVMRQRKRVLFLMAELDNETPDFDEHFLHPLLQRQRQWNSSCLVKVMPKADHSVMFEEARNLSETEILSWLDRFR